MNSVPIEIALIVAIFLLAITIGLIHGIFTGLAFLLIANIALPSIIKFQPFGRKLDKKPL